MRRRRLVWLVMCLACLGGGALVWWAGTRQSPKTVVESLVPPGPSQTTAVNPTPVPAPDVTVINPKEPSLSLKPEERFANRLSNTSQGLEQLIRNERAILLENALIDTAFGTPEIPELLRAPEDSGTYIVQARGEIDPAFRTLMREAGAAEISYIPNNAQLVRVTGAGVRRLSASPLVRSVLPYHPYYKLEPSLLKLAVAGRDLPPDVALNVGVFNDALEETRAELNRLGAEVAGEQRSSFGKILRVHPAKGTYVDVMRLSGVMVVEPARERVFANDLARPRLGVATNASTTTNHLGLSGLGVLINVNDSGGDSNHPDLTGRLIGPGSAGDANGHGTHVIGTILGNGSQSGTVTNASGSATNASFAGMASNAQAYVIGINMATGPGRTGGAPPSDAQVQEEAAGTNAFISANAWTYAGSTGYDLAAADYDAASRDALPGTTGSKPLLFVFAAGNGGGGNVNGGGGSSDSVFSPGTAKNVITVAGIEQPRNITNLVAIGGETNQFLLGNTDSSNQVAGFASRGNVGVGVEGEKGRFKPDVVAPGEFVISTASTTWDQDVYYNPTNTAFNVLRNQVVNTNGLALYSLIVPENAVSIVITVVSNSLSLSPFPPMPIYVRLDDSVSTNVYDFLGTNTVLLPPDLPLNQGGTVFFGIQDGTNRLISFDIVVAVGTTNDSGDYLTVLSNVNSGLAPWYRYESGTSMAAAGVSGMLALMQEFFEQRLQLSNSSPALMKALLINGARTVGGLYDFQVANNINYQGWGLPSLPNSIPGALTNQTGGGTNVPVRFFDQSVSNALATGQELTRTLNIGVAAREESLRITLVWTDPPGNPAAGIKLVNDLDLIVTNLDTGDVFYGNDIIAGSDFNQAVATNSPPHNDVVNNVENVYLAPSLGTNYSVTVFARRVNVNAVTADTNNVVQDYALVISSGDAGQITNAFSLTELPPVTNGLPSFTTITNGLPLLGQRVGGNSQYAGTTNGISNQWNFYVFTNTAAVTNSAFSNVAFVTFAPPNLGLPRMGVRVDTEQNAARVEADVELFVSLDPNLTNLVPAVVDAAFRSVTRTGTEKVLFTNSSAGQVYYIGVKSEDQQGAEYGFVAVATDKPFDQRDTNGNVILTVITPPLPAVIPVGSPQLPGSVSVLALTTLPVQARKVVVSDTVTHQQFGDLIGAFSHGQKFVVLNNHSFFTNVNNATETFVYDDTGEVDSLFPTARRTDGPGSLTTFIGDRASDGIWILSMVNDSSLQDVGTLDDLTALIVPMEDTNGFSRTIPPNSWFYAFVDIPVEATNLVINMTITGANANPMHLYVRRGALPDAGTYDKFAVINPPGSNMVISIFDSPPLNPGRYYIGVFNPNLVAVDVSVFWTIGLSLTPIQPLKFLSVGDEPILDDAVTYSTNHVSIKSRVASVEVGVRIDHRRESDLAFWLISPSGTRVLLAENRGGLDTNGYGSGVNFTNVFPQSTNGGPTAATNIIPVGLNEGTLIISYDMLQAPDTLRVYYDGLRIFDTGLISGAGTFSIDFGPGISTDVVVIMNEDGNPEPGTIWSYTATVVTKEMNYATFTEDTNKTTLPIKFAPPPFGSNSLIPATVVFTNGFEGATNGNYTAPALVDGWTVMDTNPVTVVTVPVLAHSGSKVLALHHGGISTTLPTVAGRNYRLVFVHHGRPEVGPVSWWKAEADASDSIDGNHGTINGGVTFAAGLVGQTFTFNATASGMVAVPDAPNLRITNLITTEAWIKPDSLIAHQAIISKVGPANPIPPGNNGYQMGLEGGLLVGQFNSPAGPWPQFRIEEPVPIVVGTWNHLAWTYDQSVTSLYFNGLLVDSAVIGPQPINTSSSLLTLSGAYRDDPMIPPITHGHLDGMIDEAAVYSNALSILQVQDIYAAGSAGKRDLLLGEPLVTANVTVGLSNRIITGGDFWSTNIFNFTAASNGTVLAIESIENGILLDSFQLLELPVLSNVFYLPEESLEKLIGENSEGDWKLEIWDNRVGATNPGPTLVSWQLSLVLERTVPDTIPLTHAVTSSNTVGPNSIAFYLVDVPPWARFATNRLIFASGPVNLLFNQDVLPGTNVNDVILLANSTGGTNTLDTISSVPPLLPGQRYYLGVQNLGATAVTFALQVDFDITTLTNAVGQTNTLPAAGLPRYYQFDVSSNAIAAAFEILNPSGNVDLVVRRGTPLPDELSFHYKSANPGTNNEAIVVTSTSLPVALAPGRWYLGVFNKDVGPVTYVIRATETGPPNIIDLTNGVPFTFIADPGVALTNFFRFVINQTNASALFELYALSGDADLTLNRGVSNYPFAPPFFRNSANTGTNGEQIVIRTNLLGTNINDEWYLGVPNTDSSNVTFTIRAVVSTNGMLISGVPITLGVTLPAVGSTNGPVLTWPSVDGEKYEVQVTADFVTWTVIVNIIANGSTTIFIDPTPVTGFPARFYRVVQVPFFTALPTIVQITPDPPNGPILTWISVIGGTYEVQVSTNLSNWTTLATVNAVSSTTTYQDPTPVTGNTVRFYRIAQLP